MTALNQFCGGLIVPYQASCGWGVALVLGAMSGVVSIVGALAGGYVCDRMDRKTAYGLFGLALAACALAMAAVINTANPVSRATFVNRIRVLPYLVSAFQRYSIDRGDRQGPRLASKTHIRNQDADELGAAADRLHKTASVSDRMSGRTISAG